MPGSGSPLLKEVKMDDDEKKNAHFAAAANSFSPIKIHFDSGIGD